MRYFLIIFTLLIISKITFANFLWNKNCKEAYSLNIQLKFNKAHLILEKEKKENPNNALVYFIENYRDYLKIQIGEEKSDFEKLKKSKDTRLDFIESDKSSSPWYLYTQAEINLQCAASRLKFGEYFTAAFEINKADRRAIANDLTKATNTDIELGKAYARQEFDSNEANLATELTRASAIAAQVLDAAKGRREAVPELLKQYQDLTKTKFEVYQKLQENSALMSAFRSGDPEKVEQALLQTEIAGAQLAELTEVHALEEALEGELVALGVNLSTAGAGAAMSGDPELDQLLKMYGSM